MADLKEVLQEQVEIGHLSPFFGMQLILYKFSLTFELCVEYFDIHLVQIDFEKNDFFSKQLKLKINFTK